MRRHVVIAASSVVAVSVSLLAPGVTFGQTPTTAPAAVTAPAAAPAIGAPPPRGGWKQLSQGVFINTKVGNPDLIEKTGNARNGRNLGIRVREDAVAHRILGNGIINMLGTTNDDKITIPGDRVHRRGTLMFITPTGQPRANIPQGTWLYIDTNASLNSRNRLIGAGLFGPDGPLGPDDFVELRMVNSTAQTYQLQLKDYNGPLSPGDVVERSDYDRVIWSDDIKGRLSGTNASGVPFDVYLGARTPTIGRDSITVGDHKHQFTSPIGIIGEPGEVCYFSPVPGTYLLGSLYGLELLNETASRVTLQLEIVSEPKGHSKCSENF